MGTKVYDSALDLLTFSRASGGTYLGSDGLLKTASTNIPRIEYAADGTVKGLLIEEQRTNLVTYSEDFTNASWNSSNITYSQDVTGPDGVINSAWTATISSVGNRLRTVGNTVTAGTSYTFSFYAKKGTATGVNYAVYDVSNAAFIVSNTSYEADINETDWSRIVVTFTVPVGCTSVYVYLASNSASTGTIYIYGAQLEAGSFATSYISTSGSTATRSADIASIPVSAFGYNQKAGTVVVEQSTFNDVKNAVVWEIDDGTANNRYVFNAFNGNTTVVNGGVVQASLNHTGQDVNVTYKHGLAYKLNNFASVYDGGGFVTDATGTLPTVSTLRFGSDTTPNAIINGHIKSLSYFPRRLTNIQLQELTA